MALTMQPTSTKRFWSAIIAIIAVAAISFAVVLFLRSAAPGSFPVEESDTNNSNQPESTTQQTPNNSGTRNNNVDKELATPEGENPKETTIVISDFAYQPKLITVKRGTTVTWKNEDLAAHTVTADSGDEPDSELLEKGEDYSYTFEKTGTYNYHCEPHPNMTATVKVVE